MNIEEERRSIGMLKALELTDVFYSLNVSEYGTDKRDFFKKLFNESITNLNIDFVNYSLDSDYIKEIIHTAKALFVEFKKGNRYPFFEYCSSINREYYTEIKDSLFILWHHFRSQLTGEIVNKIITNYLC